MATSGIDPAFGQAISALASGVSGLPETYAAGQKHLLAQQIAAFNQADKDRNFGIKKPLTEAQTRFHNAKATSIESENTARALFPELSQSFLIPVKGLNGEPDRMAFNDDPRVMARVVSNLTAQGRNPEQVINAYRSGLAGHLAAASKPGTSMPSPDAQIAASRIGKDFGATASSIFSVGDRNAVKATAEKEAMARVTAQQAAAWDRANLAATTSTANNVRGITATNSRAAASIQARNEAALARLNKPGAGGAGKITVDIVNKVEGKDLGGYDGFANIDVNEIVPKSSEKETLEAYTARTGPIKQAYADAFYANYRTSNDAAAARAAGRAAAKAHIAAPAASGPAAAASGVVAPGATTAAAPAAAVTAAAAPAPTDPAYASSRFSNPSQNIIDATDDQIAASLNLSRDELRALATEQGISTVDYHKAVTTPAQEGPVEPVAAEPADLLDPSVAGNAFYHDSGRTPDTIPNLGESTIPSADRLVNATNTRPGQVLEAGRQPASPLDKFLPPAAPEDSTVLSYDEAVAYNQAERPVEYTATGVRGRSNLTPEQQAIYDAKAAETAAGLAKPFDKTVPKSFPVPQEQVPPASPEEMARLAAEEANPAAAVSGGKKGKGKGKGKKGKAPAPTEPSVAPAAVAASPVAEAATKEQNLLNETNFLTGTNRGNPHPYNLYSRPDPGTSTMPTIEFTGNTYATAMDYKLADNSDAVFLKAIKEKQRSTSEGLFSTAIPKEYLIGSTQPKPSDYLYKPDAVEQVMVNSGVDRKSAFGKRIEELQREKYSLMNSVASQSGPAMAANGLSNGLQERVMNVNRKIDEMMNNPYAKISPSAALLVQDFINAPGLVVNSLSDIPNPENAKYVLKQSEVVHLLKTFTNVAIKPDGSYSVQYPIDGNAESNPTLSRVYSTAGEAVTGGRYVDGDRMFAAFDKAHKEVKDLFIREGRLGMKPGDSLARTLVNLTISSNKEIAASGKVGLLDPMAKPTNMFQGALQQAVK
ncbi:hypothetical protein UFOVP477_45 [uncultured Caudovirales phage]|uniref:Uncharacterized protein n=1 Tax=uncultured Caudovirales phage TaxID=2100421 RepID=A0A6J5P1B7_9CAUD|nr:hypothetical protein UFOVP477_45 [uncultured Caudovirales phage]CAB4163128.1 hypothetical protein UFOVP798_2 [uncultured Caudovirales phage]CAB4191424.1 hypothetical protein UFOVP1222_28 [uncultured Caudovirales phage]